MDVLRVTLDSWRDMVSLTTPEGQAPGDTLTGSAAVDPSVTGPVVDSAGGIHQNTCDILEVGALPWSADLLDPTDCQPTAWGYRVTLSVRGAKPITCLLTAERIAATPPVNGVRTMRLEDWAALGGGLSPGVVTAGAVTEALDTAVVDYLTTNPPPGGPPGVGIDTITAVDGIATITLTDGTTHTIKLPPGKDGHTPVVGLDGDRLTVDGVPVGGSLRGPAGHTPEVTVSGDVVTIDGQSTDPLTSTIPGPPTTLSIGEVATLPPSSPATAKIIGEPPIQTLTLGIPRGEVGPASTVPGPPGAVATAADYLIVGPGRPDTPATTGGTITGSEPVGAEYRSTDGAGVGAHVWRKVPTGYAGRASVGWAVADGDTGWRSLALGSPYATGATVRIRRIADTVLVTHGLPSQWGAWNPGVAKSSGMPTDKWVAELPAGFKPVDRTVAPISHADNGTTVGYVAASNDTNAGWLGGTHTAKSAMVFLLTAPTTAKWPTALPGTPT